jgi:hypothetical protein
MRPLSAVELRPPRIRPSRPVANRQLRPSRQTPSFAAGHERNRARFPPRTPANTGPPKLSPPESAVPSQMSALLSSVDRRTAGRRTACTESAREAERMPAKRHSPTIDHSSTSSSPHQQHRSRQFFDSRTPQFPLYRQTGRFPALAPNRPKPPIQGFATKSARTARATQSLPPQRFALVLKFSEVAAAPSFLATPQLHRPRSFTSRSCHPTSPAPQASRRRPGATQLRLTLTAFSSFPRSLRMGHPPHPPG